jgi:hypothetical protein
LFLPLRTTPDGELEIEKKPDWGVDATPFGHEVQARTSVHVLLSIEGENWRVSFGADDIVRNKCPIPLKEVMESQQRRYQLVALP